MDLRCWAEIDAEALRHNAGVCRAALPAGGGIMAIVKADAYGHGLTETARALTEHVENFGVANLAEARELAEALGDPAAASERVLILSPLLPAERADAVAEGYAVSVSDEAEVAAFAEAAAAAGKVARLHAVVDTGMGRIGAPIDEFSALIDAIRTDSGPVKLEGVASHFPSADEDAAFTHGQIARFRELIAGLALGGEVRVHLANSAGLLGFGAELGFTTEARPGLALYGISPLPDSTASSQLRPAMTWKTRVTLVREVAPGDSISYGRDCVAERAMRTATLSVGYGDGYPRSLSGRSAAVLIGGKRCALLGRVTMDQVVVDVSTLPESPAPGDEAVLMGRQGAEEIRATELAATAGTIPWEIFTGITSRVTRRYS